MDSRTQLAMVAFSMVYSFSSFELDVSKHELRMQGKPVSVEPKVFQLIAFLIEHRDRVVTKDELMSSIWRGRIIADTTLSTAVKSARRVLGDDGEARRLIKTIWGRGFRFVGELTSPDLAIDRPTDAEGTRRDIGSLPSIAVMPFINLSDDRQQEYFADGITEDVTAALGRIRWLFVIARNSMLTYKHTDDVTLVARELGVRYVLVGKVRKSGDRVRVTAQLLQGETGAQIWTERYDRQMAELFEVQDAITACIAGALEPQVGMAEFQRSIREEKRDLDAWDCVIRAMAKKSECTDAGSREAIALLEQAIEIAPNYARAYGLLAWILIWRVHQAWDEVEPSLSRAIAAAEAAVMKDSTELWAYVGWGFIATITRDAEMLVSAPQRTLEINPNFAMGHSWTGAALAVTGRGAEAFEWIEKARDLSPRDIFKDEFDVHESFAHFQVGDYDKAHQCAQRAMIAQPQHVYPRLIMAASLGHQGLAADAKSQLTKIREITGDLSLETVRSSCVFIQDKDIARFLDGLSRAGMIAQFPQR